MTSNYSFSHHENCPKCNHHDNLSVYVNEQGSTKKYCETPGCGYSQGYGGQVHRYTPPPIEYRDLSRGIPKLVCKKYGIGIDLETTLLYQLYYDEGVCIGAKVRDPDKNFKWAGSNPAHKLFGMQTVNTFNSLIITEGELDAAAAFHMTGINAVSLPNGAGSAEKAIKKNLEWIEKFKRVYICFDSDEPGVDAADKAMEVLRPGLALRVSLERKDACEYLSANDKQGFKQALDSAKGKTIDAYFTRDKLTEEWLSFWSGGNKGGVETGIKPLDDWGIRLRPGELTTVYALPAVGKSSLVRQIAANWVNKGLKVLLVPFEEQGIKYFAQVVGMVNQFKIMASPPKTMEDKVKLLASVEDKLFLSTINLATPSNKLTHLLEYACRSEDINLVIFDNITKYTATSLQQTQEIGTVMSHLVQVAQKCKAHVICVSHTSRDRELKDGQAPGLQSGYNSGSIERFSDTVITMGRVPTSNLCEVAVRKDRANNKIGEFNIIFDPVSYTFKGVNNDQENLRQPPGADGSGGSTEPDTHTEPSETECDTLHDDTCVQPGLQDSPQRDDVVHRSEGETLERRRTEVQRSSVIDEWNPSIRITKSFPTICPPQFYHYL